MAKDNSQFRPLSHIEKYWMTLGRFIQEFSQLETFIQVFLMIETKVDQTVAKAIFSGVRIDQGKSYIKRTRQALGKPDDKALNHIFEQITVITKARNEILHNGASFEKDEEEGIVSNAFRAMPGSEYSFPVSAEILDDLIGDIIRIQTALINFMAEGTGIPEEIMDKSSEAALSPWFYKSPERSQNRPPSRQGNQKQKSPPES